jgi:hypothetical protein
MKLSQNEKQRISQLYNSSQPNEKQLNEFFSRVKELLSEQKPLPSGPTSFSWSSGGYEPPKGTTAQIGRPKTLQPGDYVGSSQDKGVPVTFDGFVEALRNIVYHPVGVGVEIVISFFGIGRIAVGITYGFLLAYDINKFLEGDTSADRLFNILIGIAGVAFSGVLTPILTPLRSSAKLIGEGMEGLLNWLKTTKVWDKVSSLFKTLSSSQVTKQVKESLEYFLSLPLYVVKNMGSGIWSGIKGIGTIIGKILTGLLGSIEKITQYFGKVASKGLEKIGVPEWMAGPLGLGTAGGTMDYVLSGGGNANDTQKKTEVDLLKNIKIADVELTPHHKEIGKKITDFKD